MRRRRIVSMKPALAFANFLRQLALVAMMAPPVLALCSTPAWGASEPNDTCEGATVIQFDPRGGGGGTLAGDLSTYANDYEPGIEGMSCTGHGATGNDLVLKVDMPCGGGLSVRCTPVGFDASIYIVTDCSDIYGTCVAGADRNGVGGFEEAAYDVSRQGTYYIIVDARGSGTGGPVTLNYSFGIGDFPPGACCYPDGRCVFMHIDPCYLDGGQPNACVLCDPYPCAGTPATERTWGAIKNVYR